jgi:hypothetical protein
MVVSRCTLGYRSARARCSAYSGMPRCAITAVSVGWRRSTAPNGPGPVCRPGTGPEPQWTTTGTPASASRPQTASSSPARGSNPPTWRWTLKMRVPASSAAPT